MKFKFKLHDTHFTADTTYTRELAEFGLKMRLQDAQANRHNDPEGARRRLDEVMKRYNVKFRNE